MAKRDEKTPYIRLNQKITAIREQWNALKPKEKRTMLENDPDRVRKIRDKMYQGNFLQEGKEIISLENRKFGLTGQELRNANKNQNDYLYNEITLKKERTYFARLKRLYTEKVQNRNISKADKKMKKIIDEYDLGDIVKSPNQLMNKGIPNTALIKLGKENYMKLRKQINEVAGKRRMNSRELEADAEAKWAEAMREVDILNKTADYGEYIKKNAIDYMKGFMEDHYFLNAGNINQEQRIINEYMKHLDPAQIYKIEDVLTDPKFLELWDSDQESETYDSEFIAKRQKKLIDILRNETGLNIYKDPKNPHGALIVEESKGKYIQDLSMENYITQ